MINLLNIRVSSRGGIQRNFTIRPARGADPRTVAGIYNQVLDKTNEAGMAVTPEQIETRLSRDPASVHLGFIDGTPASLINVVKLDLDSLDEIPTSHQALTDNESFASSDPQNGNMWFCPWVAVTEDARGYKAELNGKQRSIGQLHVLTVWSEAVVHGHVDRVFAYSRPAMLKRYLEHKLGKGINPVPVPENRNAIILTDGGFRLHPDREGIRNKDGYLLTMQKYWDRADCKGRKRDPVFNFHFQNGARFRPDLIMPYGQIFDGSALCYRTLLEYPLS